MKDCFPNVDNSSQSSFGFRTQFSHDRIGLFETKKLSGWETNETLPMMVCRQCLADNSNNNRLSAFYQQSI